MSSQTTLQVTIDPSGAVTGSNKVSSSISRMTRDANSNLSALQRSFRQLDSFINRATGSISRFFKTMVVVDGLKHLLDRLIDVNTMYVQFTATIGAVKDSAQAAREEFEWLLATSNRLGQNVETQSKNYMRLAASMKHVDSTGESTRHVFEGIAAAASVLHLKGFEANGILIAFEQILSKNKLSLEEVQRQLSNRMPDAMGTAARAMNMSQEEFRKGIEKNTIHPLEFVIRMANELKKEYGAAAKETANAFVGQQARMHNAIMNLYRTAGESGAMDGLIDIVVSLTDKLSDASVVETLGQALGDMFSEIATWIDAITAQDVEDFFSGLGLVIQSVTEIMRGLILAFSDTVDGKADFLDFCEAASRGLLAVVEVARTLISGMLLIPQTVGYIYNKVRALGRTLSPENFGIGGGDPKKFKEESAKLEAQIQKQIQSIKKSANTLFIDGRLPGVDDKLAGMFKNLRDKRDKKNADTSLKAPKIDQFLPEGGEMWNESKIMERAKEGGPSRAAKPKTGRGRKGKSQEDIFNTESVNLAKMAATSMLEYNNIMNDTLDIENRQLTQLEIKFRYDRDYIKLSEQKRDALRQLAQDADLAASKEKAAQAFQSDKLEMNKAMFQGESAILDVLEYRNALESTHQRQFEEKLKFDSRYKSFSEEMIQIERDKAKALDEQAVKLDRITKLEQSRFATRLSEVQMERDLSNLRKGLNPNRYNERDSVVDSIRKGGDQFNNTPENKLKMLDDASKRDEFNKTRDSESFAKSMRENLSMMDEERAMIGQSTFAIQAYTEKKRVDDFFKQQGIDLTLEQNSALKKLADTLKNQITQAYDNAQVASQDWVSGLRSGLATYLDEISNVSKNMEQMTVRVFKGMEDSLVDFVMTGKFNFRDFATMVIKELVRIMIQITIMKPLMQALQSSSLFGFADGGAFDGGQQVFAKGGVFKRFAKGDIVDKPTNFMMGQMGERGAEAIMPLTRDAQGRLGVRSQGDGGGGVGDVSIHVTIVEGQERVESKSGNSRKDAQALAERMKHVAVQTIYEELRPGGSLAKARS